MDEVITFPNGMQGYYNLVQDGNSWYSELVITRQANNKYDKLFSLEE